GSAQRNLETLPDVGIVGRGQSFKIQCPIVATASHGDRAHDSLVWLPIDCNRWKSAVLAEPVYEFVVIREIGRQQKKASIREVALYGAEQELESSTASLLAEIVGLVSDDE